ncbi:MAG TPA: DUF3810 domain-containing protein [Vicinamibacterales bacterium]|nr:DUF3810 domain-containing protein [Vicinamibacterales bacterium]
MLKFALILAAAIVALVPLPRHAVERAYSRGVYPLIQPKLTGLSNSTPFAWFDALVVLAIGATIVVWAIRLKNRQQRLLPTVAGLAVDTAAIAAVLYFWFLASWGLNYQRQPLREQLDFREDRITREALRALATRTVATLNTLHHDAHAAGWPELTATPDVLEPAFAQAQHDLAMSWTAHPGRPKRTVFNFYFTRVSIDGMTGPFFLETLANDTLLPFERAATLAHEWSHLAGYADESEANFLGWLVCMRGPVPIQYSGWLSLYGTIVGALPRSDRDEITRVLGEGPRADLRAISDRIRRYTIPAASRAGYALYDRFLKANRVEAGVRSYGEVLRLLLGTKFNEDGRPVLRTQG